MNSLFNANTNIVGLSSFVVCALRDSQYSTLRIQLSISLRTTVWFACFIVSSLIHKRSRACIESGYDSETGNEVDKGFAIIHRWISVPRVQRLHDGPHDGSTKSRRSDWFAKIILYVESNERGVADNRQETATRKSSSYHMIHEMVW